MYRKVLVPLTGSTDNEKSLAIVKDVLVPMGEVILLQVIQDESRYDEVMEYLERVGQEAIGDSMRWYCVVRIGKSVYNEVLDVADWEGVDLIAMYDEDGSNLLNTIKGSTTTSVRLWSPVEVRVFGSQESEAVPQSQDLETGVLSSSYIFQVLSGEQKARVASLSQWMAAPAGQELVTSGEVGQNVYVIKSGDVRLSTSSPTGEITVRIAGPGESFPLAALVGEGTLITSAKTLTDSEMLQIPRASLVDLCFSDPEIGVRVYSAVANTFASRYSKTLNNLGTSAERELRSADFLTNV